MSAPGRSFGPYEVISPLGAGGMGEVFKARDTRLGRLVALKTSREQFSDRFAGEARATAALNHPNIATLYDVGPDYLVLEFVEGETLHGPLPLDRALTFAAQILDALEAAHRKGIVHRDLKPANIMVCKSGIKLLDFGLAQMKTVGPLGDRTATMALSTEGTIAGTLQYMAPEQLQGKPASPRSDIFAFGLVLYEMLTGRPAFGGPDSASVISAIMTAEPPSLPDSPAAATPGLSRILKQCLAKDPDERWQNAADVRRALELVQMPRSAAHAVSGQAKPSVRLRWVWLAAAFAAGALLVFGAFRLRAPRSAEAWTFRPLTYSGTALGPSISPDGKQVAFLWNGEKERSLDLYVRLVSGGSPLRLAEAHPAGRAAWSPDGSHLAFRRPDGLYAIPALGGAPRRIAAFPPGAEGSDAAWSPDGAFLIFSGPGSGISVISAEGGETHELTHPAAAGDHSPAISPDGRSLAFVRHTNTYNSAVMVLPLDRDMIHGAPGTAKQITTNLWDVGSLDWTADGRDIIFEGSTGSGNAGLWRLAANGGEPVRFHNPSVMSGGPSVARQADRMVYADVESETKIFKMTLGAHAGEPQPLVEAIGDHRDLEVSADGSRIAFTSNRTGSKEIWIASADGSNQTQLTSFNGPSVGSPRWSPDGNWIAFDAYASGSSDIYLVSADGGKPRQLTSDPNNETRPSWSHDGQWIYYGWDKSKAQKEIWKIHPAGGQPVQVTHNGGDHALETPDGQWLYVADPPKLSRMRPNDSEETVVRNDVYLNYWNLGSRNLYMFDLRHGALLRTPFAGGPFETVYQFTNANYPMGGGTSFAMPRDESYLIYRRRTRQASTVILIEAFR